MTPNIVVPQTPDPGIRAMLMDLMLAYNESRTGPSGFAPLAVVLKDEDSDEMIGGLWGRTVYEWLFIEFLFVPEHLRGRGLGARLLRAAEATARDRGCIGVCLDTFDFNAPGFYKKFGYEAVAALETPKRGFKRHTLTKDLGTTPKRLA